MKKNSQASQTHSFNLASKGPLVPLLRISRHYEGLEINGSTSGAKANSCRILRGAQIQLSDEKLIIKWLDTGIGD